MQLDEPLGEGVRVVEVAVAELAGAPVVALDAHAVAAVLGQGDDPPVAPPRPTPPPRRRHRERPQVGVEAADVAAALVDPAAGVVDLPGGVEVGDRAGDAVGVELAPALVERRPHGERDDVAEQLDGLAHLAPELLATGGVAPLVEPVQAVGDPDRVPGRARGGQVPVAAAAVDDVLPHQHAEAVAVRVPAQRLDLRVLAQHGEAERLHRLDVVDHRLVAGRGEQAVGPVALVEHADVGDRLAVERAAGRGRRGRRLVPKERRAAYDVTRSSPSVTSTS